VLPVNPDLIARRRGDQRARRTTPKTPHRLPPRADRHAGLKPLVPHGALACELRTIARNDERTARDQTRLLNRLRADLTADSPPC
jgi:hypothetical protein